MNHLEDTTFERELLLLECQKAETEGRDRVNLANKALAALDRKPDSSYEVYAAAALACYNAGIDTRLQQHFANAAEIGRRIVDRFADPVQKAEGLHFVGISLPRTEPAEQRKHWEQALALLETVEMAGYALHLKAKIANSLAEHLSYGTDLEKSMARKLFETSIEIKSRPDVDDEPGLAMSHGGLGRLALFAEKPDYVMARHHFTENLRISEAVGSIIGQTKMNSLLGAVDVAENRLVDAKQRYTAALRLASEDVDKIYALSGLVNVRSKLGQESGAAEAGALLCELIKDRVTLLDRETREKDPGSAIPRSCMPRIAQALSAAAEQTANPWHQWLTSVIRDNHLSSS